MNETSALALFSNSEYAKEAYKQLKGDKNFFQLRPLTSMNVSAEALKRARELSRGVNEEPDLRTKRKNWSKHAKHIFDRTGGLCYLCKKPIAFEKKGDETDLQGWTIEHVFPIAKYPEMDVLANLLPAHSSCNREGKGSHSLQSIATGSTFNLMTAALDIQSLHPDVKEEIRQAKKLHLQRKLQQAEKDKLDIENLIEDYLIQYSELDFSANQVLGKGSYGDVVKAKWSGLPVAVKIAHHKAFNQGFEKEVGILCRLRQ